jgi:hypothetical protein
MNFPPGDLLLRHETLAHHHDDLMQRSVTFSALADEARARLQEVSLLQRETKLKGDLSSVFHSMASPSCFSFLTRFKGHNDVATLQKTLETTQLDITAKTRDLELKQITGLRLITLGSDVGVVVVTFRYQAATRRWSWGEFVGLWRICTNEPRQRRRAGCTRRVAAVECEIAALWCCMTMTVFAGGGPS